MKYESQLAIKYLVFLWDHKENFPEEKHKGCQERVLKVLDSLAADPQVQKDIGKFLVDARKEKHR